MPEISKKLCFVFKAGFKNYYKYADILFKSVKINVDIFFQN